MSRGAEVFATRWTPIIVRNLLRGCRTFSEIRAGAPGISRTLLTQRLRMLEHYGVVERTPAPAGQGFLYELTESGRALKPVCDALAAWGERWIESAPEHFDPGTVLWSFCTLIPDALMPPRRAVIRLNLWDTRDRYWLLLDPPDAEVCAKPPGFPEDVVVSATSEGLAGWHTGRLSLGAAMRDGLMTVDGTRDLVRWLASVGGLGSVAGAARADALRAASAAAGRG
jgi:DNA-binding HxlR family transcriptional regulator